MEPSLAVVLVDERDHERASAAKLVAHEPPGMLHRAFSVVLYRRDGSTLLQQRAATKYHFPLHWANACCSHPAPGEDVRLAAEQRLVEELGVRVRLAEAGTFIYRATCPVSGLVEHELDHVLVGELDEDPSPAPGEVAALAWVYPAAVLAGDAPEPAAPWLARALEIAEGHHAPAAASPGRNMAGR